MRNSFNFSLPLLLTVLCASLSACGGGADALMSGSTGGSAASTLSSGISSTSSSSTAPAGVTASTSWTPCATEDGTCNFAGTAEVRYGTASASVVKTVTGPVACSNSVFGDPAPGYLKSCSVGTTVYSTLPAPAPSSAPTAAAWTTCATEGGICNFSGTAQVLYGTATGSVIKTVTGPVACSNGVFGDPDPGYTKYCSLADPSAIASISAPTPSTSPSTVPSSGPAPVLPPLASVSGATTTVQLGNATAAAQTDAAATFGQVFGPGDVPGGVTLVGRTASGVAVPLQVDVKARHPDGSLRHAVITAQLPSIASNGYENVGLIKSTSAAASSQTTPAGLLNSGFTASFTATIGGVQYSASADAALKSGQYRTWLSGPLVNEWLVSAPLKTASGAEHPHLTAQFAIRSYAGSTSARVDVAVENGWAFQASPQNATYDAQMLVGGQTVYSQAALTHYHHARWRKVFWWGKAPALNVRHDVKYLLASKALPNYDQSLVIQDATIASWKNNWNASKNGPMQPGLGMAYMPTTGARSDIGLMPAWNALYLLSQDQRMKDVALGMSEAAGAWSTHYRDKNTGRPVTLAQYPYMSIITSSNDTINPATQQREAFPDCPEPQCTTPMTADDCHQAAFAYVPYLLTGDYYHLEELEFWANFTSFYNNPAYRQGATGLVQPTQVRGQAWSLRTLAEAAYIIPDNDPQKANFMSVVNNNIDWYNTTYTNNTAANKLGVVVNGYAIEYDNNTGLAPWQDDFFTMAVGRMVELGFSKAQPLLTWKSKFVVDRMVGDGFCWIEAPLYSMKVRDSATAPFYTTIKQVYQANNTAAFTDLACGSAAMAASLNLRVGDMVSGVSADGSQAIMQPALAYAVGFNANGAKAWSLYAGRLFKPDYASQPQYAIVPR